MAPWERGRVRTSFLIVDHDARSAAVVRESLRPYPSTHVGSIADARSVLSEGGTVGVVIDERPGGESALALVDEIRAHDDMTPILVLMRSGDVRIANQCHLRGAHSVARDGSGPNLRRFARDATAGPSARDVEAACATFERRYRLTRRLSQVLRALVRISGTAAIAVELGIGKRTVEGHVQTLMDKLGMSSREEVIIAVLSPSQRANRSYVDGRTDEPRAARTPSRGRKRAR